MTWVEKQFQRKKEKKEADEIRERFAQMVEHVRRTEARLDRYRRVFREVQELHSPVYVDTVSPGAILDALNRGPTDWNPLATADRARQLADKVLSLVGTENAAAECGILGEQVRCVGELQNRELAIYRMKARWLRQSAMMLAEDHPEQAELAKKIQSKAEEMLQTK